jgi:hypothetical protein
MHPPWFFDILCSIYLLYQIDNTNTLSTVVVYDWYTFFFSLSLLPLHFFRSIRLRIICLVAFVRCYYSFIIVRSLGLFCFVSPCVRMRRERKKTSYLLYKIFRHRIFNRPKKGRCLLKKTHAHTIDIHVKKRRTTE